MPLVTASIAGGFGFNKTTLSERQGALGVAGEYQYLADPIHQATRKPADAAAVKPFRPANPPPTGGPGTVTRNLLGRAAGAVGEFEWRPRPEAAAAGSSSGADGAAAAEAAAAPVPFKPVSVPRKGPMATFNQFPGGQADSISVQDDRFRATVPAATHTSSTRSMLGHSSCTAAACSSTHLCAICSNRVQLPACRVPA